MDDGHRWVGRELVDVEACWNRRRKLPTEIYSRLRFSACIPSANLKFRNINLEIPHFGKCCRSRGSGWQKDCRLLPL